MPSMKINDIVNPNITNLAQVLLVNESMNLSDLNPEDIPDDVQAVGAVDADGKCKGTISAKRLHFVLGTIKKMKLAPILDELEEAVVDVDMDGMNFYANPAYTRILGVPVGKILGKNLHIIENGANLLEVLRTGTPITRERQLSENTIFH